jgi:signal transduction histidine kinase/CheY-like chemotaxis protein
MSSDNRIYTQHDLIALLDLAESPVVILDEQGKLVASNRLASIDPDLKPLSNNSSQTIPLSNNHQVVSHNRPLQVQQEISSVLLSNITHELRTPLNSIQGMTKLSREICTQPELQEYLGHIEQSVHLLSDFVYVLIEYMTIMNGDLVLQPKPIDTEDFFLDLSRSHIHKAHEKGLQFALYLSPNLPDSFSVDSARLNLICNQLIGNAIKFSNEGTVWVRVTEEENQLQITIVDQGIGISEQFVHRVFNPFEQEVFQYTRKHGGSGIGLTIVKKLVDVMTGTIHIDSKKDSGTKVTIRLPIFLCSEETLGSFYRHQVHTWILVTTNPVIETLIKEFAEHFSVTCQLVQSINELSTYISADIQQFIFVDDSSVPASELQQIHTRYPKAIRLQGFSNSHGTTIPLQGLSRLVYPFTPKSIGKLFDASSITWKRSMFQSKDVFSGYRILIVEDDAINLLTVVRFFTSRGAMVYQANHVHKAIDLLTQHPIDLALVDIGLPEISGFELLRLIREGEVDVIPPSLPVIALTAYSSQEDRLRMKAAGFSEIIHKPYEPDILAMQVYAIVHNSKDKPTFIEKIASYLKLEQYSKIEIVIEQKKRELSSNSGKLDQNHLDLETLLLKCLIASRSGQKEKLEELLNNDVLKNL